MEWRVESGECGLRAAGCGLRAAAGRHAAQRPAPLRRCAPLRPAQRAQVAGARRVAVRAGRGRGCGGAVTQISISGGVLSYCTACN